MPQRCKHFTTSTSSWQVQWQIRHLYKERKKEILFIFLTQYKIVYQLYDNKQTMIGCVLWGRCYIVLYVCTPWEDISAPHQLAVQCAALNSIVCCPASPVTVKHLLHVVQPFLLFVLTHPAQCIAYSLSCLIFFMDRLFYAVLTPLLNAQPLARCPALSSALPLLLYLLFTAHFSVCPVRICLSTTRPFSCV